jgi:hypothetical protein
MRTCEESSKEGIKNKDLVRLGAVFMVLSSIPKNPPVPDQRR